MGIKYISVIFLLCCFHCINSARVLCLFPLHSESSQEVFHAICEEIASKGHQVTLVTTMPFRNNTLDNLLEINIGSTIKNGGQDTWSRISSHKTIFKEAYEGVEEKLNHPHVQHLIKDQRNKFHVILVDVRAPAFMAFAEKFDCPLIGVSATPAWPSTLQAIGESVHPILNTGIMYNVKTFWDRVRCVYYDLWIKYYYFRSVVPHHDALVKKHFGKKTAYIGDIEGDISLLFQTTNLILRKPRPYSLSVIDISATHIRKRPLPEDIQQYIQSARSGVVFINVGSEIDSEKVEALNDILFLLPYKVLWKYRGVITKHISNVKIVDDVSQQDVLSHPNVKGCIIEANIQSIEEAITYKVPFVGVPFAADQVSNMERLEEINLAVHLPLDHIRKDVLKASTILKVIDDSSYKKRLEASAKVLQDQPLKSLDKIVWWTEYLIRNGKVQHLKAPAADLPWIQFLLIDVLSALALVVLLFVSILYLIYKHTIHKYLKNKALYRVGKKNI